MEKEYKKRIYIAIFSVVFSFIMIVFARLPVKTVQAICNNYEVKIPFKGIYFTPEDVIYKGDLKALKIKYNNGDKIKKGSVLGKGLIAKEGGVLITSLDGYENLFTQQNIKGISIKKINDIINQKDVKTAGLKTINNDQWYLCVFIDSRNRLEVGDVEDIAIDNINYKAQVTSKFKDKYGTYLIMKLRNDLDIFDLRRGVAGYIIKSRYYGIILPSRAIVEDNGDTGVFVNHNGYAEFRKIKVKFKGEGVTIVEPSNYSNGIQEYDDVICNPEKVGEGTKVK